ncbi:MAG TPA: hypothetical protein VK539_37985 [Myxococcaceae bacterium]|nr:hypothetical protein [Myxococcaceae bacterium]
MTQVEVVALWTGLISGIVSIVLSIVAIVFSVLVNQRSDKVSDQTIQSLERIGTTVERLSEDTRVLIKNAWEKLLGGFGSPPPSPTDTTSTAKEVASGLAAEFRAELNAIRADTKNTGTLPAEMMEQVNRAISRLESSLTAQIRAEQRRSDRSTSKLDFAIAALNSITPTARELARAIQRAHLTSSQYRKLSEGPLSEALGELRGCGLLIPVTPAVKGDENPVYYFPPSIVDVIRSALLMFAPSENTSAEVIARELSAVGYTYHAAPKKPSQQD